MWTPADHLFQLFVMLTVVLSAQVLARRSALRQRQREAQRLRIILAIGFAALRGVYEDNLRMLVDSDGRKLSSSRHHIGLLRTQLARIVYLEGAEAAAVMNACVAAERAEVALMQPPGNEAARRMLELVLRETCSQLLDTEQRLDPGAAASLPGRVAALSAAGPAAA